MKKVLQQTRRNIMKRTIISLAAFASMFVLGAAPNAQARDCSNASLKGAYGIHQGQIRNGDPVGVLTRTVFDGKGNFTVTAWVHAPGLVFGSWGPPRDLEEPIP